MLLFGWGYLLAKLWHEPLSAFKVYVAWALIRGIVLNAYLWANWPGYSDAYWVTRSITLMLTVVVASELWSYQPYEGLKVWSYFTFRAAPAVAAGVLSQQWPLTTDRAVGFAVCAACVLRLIWRHNDSIITSRALGLLVLTLFPAIAEMPYVLDLGGWLRFTPVYAGLACQVIWIYGIHHPASILRTRSRSA